MKVAEEAAEKRNMKDLYSCAKKLAGNYHRIQKPVKDKHGKPLTTAQGQLKRWAEHFRKLLNRPAPLDPPDILPSHTVLPLKCGKSSKSEIRAAIQATKNGKAAGQDGVPAEAMKADMSTSADILYRLFARIWEEGSIPEEWRKGIIVKVPKKGDLGDCNDHRGIMLLSVPGKVLNRILLERMKTTVDTMLRDQQAAFRKDRPFPLPSLPFDECAWIFDLPAKEETVLQSTLGVERAGILKLDFVEKKLQNQKTFFGRLVYSIQR